MTMTKYQAMTSLNKDMTIVLIGCGGTGALVLHGLANIVSALYATGRKNKIDLVAYDADTVSAANIGRQPFYPAEIGQNKAACLVNRVNLQFGLDWKAIPKKVTSGTMFSHNSLVVGCVDSRRSRKSIMNCLNDRVNRLGYYIDCGNDQHSGQVLIGCRSYDEEYRLPMPWETCPALVSDDPEDNTPSCSLAEALNSQDLMVNRFSANIALELVWQLLRYNTLENRGAFFDCHKLKMIPVPIQSVKPQRKSNKAGGK